MAGKTDTVGLDAKIGQLKVEGLVKVVLVMSDGLGDSVARERMGYLEHLVEEAVASRFVSRAAIPTVSRTNYETIHTGVSPQDHGITSNFVVRRSTFDNIFAVASGAGLTTAAVAYYWVGEIFHKSPYDPLADAEHDDPASAINHGRFYYRNDQPDGDVIFGAVTLSKRFSPDYLLVHPMGVDLAGHLHGGNSSEYRAAVGKQDEFLGAAIPEWREAGYAVLVTGDHGHYSDGGHGGTSDAERNVPLYAIPPMEGGLGETDQVVDHIQIAPTICGLLGVEPADTMTAPGFKPWG